MRVFGVDARRTARLSRFQRLSGKDNDGGHRLSCVGGGVRFGCGFFKKSAFNRHVGHNVRAFRHISYIAGALLQAHEKTDISYGSVPSSLGDEGTARVENRDDIFRLQHGRGRADADICEGDMNFVGRKVVVYGAGASGICAYELLREKGARAIVYDDDPSRDRATNSVGVFKDADIIVLSPGVNPNKEFLLDARLENKIVTSELNLASSVCAAEQIAVTGTNGKTTTTMLIDHILKRAGIHSHAVGNIGVPFSSIADKLDATETAVIEASSYQLENSVGFSPEIAVLLNVKPDHMTRHLTMKNYENAKANIFRAQSESDYLVYNADDDIVRNMASEAVSQKVPFSTEHIEPSGAYVSSDFLCFRGNPIVPVDEIDFKGEELQNALAAVATCMIKGVSAFCTASALADFKRPSYRRQLVAIAEGVYVYNDSKSTNVSACLCACTSVGDCVLMLGGRKEEENFDELFSKLPSSVKAITVQGENAETILKSAKTFGFKNIRKHEDLQSAIASAFELAKKFKTESILFSPASKSFDLYANFEERAKKFDSQIADYLAKR